MNKQEIIEWFRYDGEWWFLPVGTIPVLGENSIVDNLRIEYGWATAQEYETEGWFNLLIAEALDTEGVEYANPLLNNSSASIMLINAMATVAPEDLQPLFNPEYVNGKCNVKVELKVNGVRVPFMEEVERGWKILEASLDEEVKKRALELISRAKLDGVLNALENAEWQIEQALNKALKDQQ